MSNLWCEVLCATSHHFCRCVVGGCLSEDVVILTLSSIITILVKRILSIMCYSFIYQYLAIVLNMIHIAAKFRDGSGRILTIFWLLVCAPWLMLSNNVGGCGGGMAGEAT